MELFVGAFRSASFSMARPLLSMDMAGDERWVFVDRSESGNCLLGLIGAAIVVDGGWRMEELCVFEMVESWYDGLGGFFSFLDDKQRC